MEMPFARILSSSPPKVEHKPNAQVRRGVRSYSQESSIAIGNPIAGDDIALPPTGVGYFVHLAPTGTKGQLISSHASSLAKCL